MTYEACHQPGTAVAQDDSSDADTDSVDAGIPPRPLGSDNQSLGNRPHRQLMEQAVLGHNLLSLESIVGA